MTTDLPRAALLALPTRRVGKVPFRIATLDEAVAAVLDAARSLQRERDHHRPAQPTRAVGGQPTRGMSVHFGNAYTVALADSETTYAELLANPDAAVFTDGLPIAWVGRRAHPELAARWQRVYGPDVMEAVLRASGPEGPSHYLLGGTPQTLERLRSAVAARWPAAHVSGAESPPFRPLSPQEAAAQDERIRASGASIVWVGLGTPKQDWEAARLTRELPVVAMAVGAAFDFIAGAKPQAALWMQRSGTEWAFRLASEPRRLSRRYLWGNPRFLRAAARNPGLGRSHRRSERRPHR